MGRMNPPELERLTAEEIAGLVRRRPQPVVFIPSGSLEQHGPHLPLGTDAINSLAIARETARETGGVLAPQIPYTWVGGTRAFPVAVNVPAFESMEYAAEGIRAFHAWGFRKFVVVNCHGGAIASYRLLADELRREGIRIMVLYGPSSPPADTGPARIIEGLEREASTCLGALRLLGLGRDEARIMERIREAAEALRGFAPPPPPDGLDTVRRWADTGFDYYYESMHVAPTTKVSAERGAAFIRALAKAFAPYIKAFGQEAGDHPGRESIRDGKEDAT